MRKQLIGFALILFGILIAVAAQLMEGLIIIAILLGIVGLYTVFVNSQDNGG